MTIIFSVIGHRIEALCPIFASVWAWRKVWWTEIQKTGARLGWRYICWIWKSRNRWNQWIIVTFLSDYRRYRFSLHILSWSSCFICFTSFTIRILNTHVGKWWNSYKIWVLLLPYFFIQSLLCLCPSCVSKSDVKLMEMICSVSINSCGVNGLARLYSSIYINLLDVNDDLLLTLTAEDTLLSESHIEWIESHPDSQMIEWSSLLTTNYPIIDLPNEWMIHIINISDELKSIGSFTSCIECILIRESSWNQVGVYLVYSPWYMWLCTWETRGVTDVRRRPGSRKYSSSYSATSRTLRCWMLCRFC